MILVNTPIKETFPIDKSKKVLFLGEWCKLYSQKDFYKKYNYTTLAYHWDNRERLYNDTKYIDSIYENYLEQLKDNLNNIHNVSFSISYWRVILGPWLRYFIEMIYDRYLSIIEASKLDIDYVNIIDIDEMKLIPNNMSEFNQLYTTDLWNQFIYQYIIKHTNIKSKKLNINIDKYYLKKSKKISIKSKILDSMFFLNHFNKIHIFNSYMGIKNSIFLQLKLRQIPTLGITLKVDIDVEYSKEIRKRFLFKNSNHFENILNKLIIKQIPKYYLEGYSEFRKKVIYKYPKQSKIIFTANSYSSDDSFKLWTAEQKELGSKYIIGQHGGGYFMWLFASNVDHQIKSSDRFFSWGYKLDNFVVPISAIKLKKKIEYNINGDILIPTMKIPRYSYHLYSIPIAGQFLKYIESQINFLSLLSIDIKRIIKFRTFPNDYGWDIQKRLLDSGYPNIIDSEENMKKSFHQRLSECRLCIATYNATTYLETFAANYPTLIYWEGDYWEVREEVKPYFKALEDVGILHYKLDSLVEELDKIYLDPLSWWHQDKIQNAKDYFCDKFANTNNYFIDDYIREIGKIID